MLRLLPIITFSKKSECKRGLISVRAIERTIYNNSRGININIKSYYRMPRLPIHTFISIYIKNITPALWHIKVRSLAISKRDIQDSRIKTIPARIKQTGIDFHTNKQAFISSEYRAHNWRDDRN